MFARFLCVALLGASVCRAAVPDGNANTIHELRLQCTPCAFADRHCKQDAYLTLSLTTQNDTLLANDHAIFPASPRNRHGHFPAVRHWDSRTNRETQDVQVACTLAVAQSGSSSHGTCQVKDLEMTLLDTHGNLASPIPLYITLIQCADRVVIANVGLRQHKPTIAPPQTKVAKLSTWVKYWKYQIGSYVITREVAGGLSGLSQLQATSDNSQDTTPEDNTQKETHHPHRPRPHKESAYRPYRGDHAVPRLLRPVLLPALLGILAGLVACIFGFVLGRITMAAYFQARHVSVVRDEEREGERGVFPEDVIEK